MTEELLAGFAGLPGAAATMSAAGGLTVVVGLTAFVAQLRPEVSYAEMC